MSLKWSICQYDMLPFECSGGERTSTRRARTMAPNVADDAKRKIKKLTNEKIEEFRAEIEKGNGQADLSGRGIETIVSLEGLQQATKLDLSRNKLTKLTHMKEVPGLTMIRLTDNNLNGEGLAELQHLKKLVILNVAENQVTRIPMETLRNLKQLKALVLNNNAITTLEWVPSFPELNSLIVSHNRIHQLLPRTIDRLPNLTKISMTHNLLEDLPDLSSLKNLTELRFSHNKLKTVPPSLARLPNLKILELGHNEIDEWKGIEALSELKNLKQLSLTGNPIYGVPMETKKKADSGSSSEDDDDKESDLSANEKTKLKEAKRLDAKHKQYNFKMKRLFPNLVIRDGHRVLGKKVHGYVAPPKEEKKVKKLPKKNKEGEQNVEKGTKESKTEDGRTKRKRGDAKAKEGDTLDNDESEQPAKVMKKTHHKASKGDRSGSPPVERTGDQVHTSASAAEGRKDNKQSKDAQTENGTKKTKKKGEKARQSKVEREPKEIASGVVAVKQFKKSKPAKQNKDGASVDLTKVDFAPGVGMGGASAWD